MAQHGLKRVVSGFATVACYPVARLAGVNVTCADDVDTAELAGCYSTWKCGGGAGPAQSGAKTGEACAMSILGIVAVGDASVEAAKAEGGVSKVSTVDYAQFGILGIYANTCTVVKGE